MTDKVIVPRELLERLIKADADLGRACSASTTNGAIQAIEAAFAELRALLGQPEPESMTDYERGEAQERCDMWSMVKELNAAAPVPQTEQQPRPIGESTARLMHAYTIGEFKSEGGSETVEAMAVESYDAQCAEAVTDYEIDSYMAGFAAAMYEQAEPLLALTAAPVPQASPSFQQRVQPWLLECFGQTIANDAVERNHRFLEEALELVQACGCTADEAHKLVDYVFVREIGVKSQEVGGVMVTLAALCLAQGLDMRQAAERELARIAQPVMIERIREKQKRKPSMSPLPGVYPDRRPPSGAPDEAVRDVARRSPQDYAIEYAEYMAASAESVLSCYQSYALARMAADEGGDDGEGERAEAIDNAEQDMIEALVNMRSMIYGFRKRRDRAAAAPKQVAQ